MSVKTKAVEYYNGLPGWAKGIVVVGGLGIAWFGIINPIRKVIMKKLDASKMNQEAKQAGNEVRKLAKDGIFPTITKTQVEAMCNSLNTAFSGPGTDEFAIYTVMSQLNNEADIYLLIDSYGVRTYTSSHFLESARNYSLSAAISDELDGSEKNIVNAILKKNGIKFRFS